MKGSVATAGAGFSLLEMIMVLALVGLLASAIFGITIGTFQLSSEIREAQSRSEAKDRLIEILESNLLSLPAGAQIELTTTQTDGSYTNLLALGKCPLAFQRSGEDRGTVDGVVIQTGKGRGGFIRVTLHHLESEQWQAFERNDLSVFEEDDSIILAERLKQFRWQFFDPTTRRWVGEWKIKSRRPVLAELSYAHEGERDASKHIFWIPPRSPN
ncbi:MAG: prepilin-type N-terminal cleavage/methylation domain-containing protein [Verrucomicrobiales bacterium]|nr:prepilin-type N-terminal cleavage/methylation domain-containing protein [Verrucomicrobiales bacterium]